MKHNLFGRGPVCYRIMEVVAACGYAGQRLEYLGNDKVAYVSGTGICVHNIVSGPKEILWRSQEGVQTFKSHAPTDRLAISYYMNNANVEISSLSTYTKLGELENPSAGKIKDISFSWDGERLVGISDYSDHKLVIWSTVSSSILVISELKAMFDFCVLNPVDHNRISLISADRLELAEVKELFGEFSVEFKPSTLEAIVSADIKQQTDVSSNINFASWAPDFKIFLGLSSGEIIYFDPVTSTALFYFTLSDEGGTSSPVIPLCGALTAECLIIADSTGTVSWFGLGPLLLKGDDTTEFHKIDVLADQVCPLQSSFKGKEQSVHMNLNDTFESVVLGSRNGSIFKLSANLQAVEEVAAGEEEGEEVETQSAVKTNVLEAAKSFVELDANAIICSKFMELKIFQMVNGKLKSTPNSLSLLMTGSHTGEIAFWKSPPPNYNTGIDVDMSYEVLKKSLPGTLQLLERKWIENAAHPISLLESYPSKFDHGGRFVIIGNLAGYLEIRLVQAVDTEGDEEPEEVHDHDSGNTIKLRHTVIYKEHFFNTAVTTVSASSNFEFIAISSFQESRIFLLKWAATKKTFYVAGFFDVSAVNSSLQVMSMLWSHLGLLRLVCKDGTIIVLDVNGHIAETTVQGVESSMEKYSIETSALFGPVTSFTSNPNGIGLAYDENSKSMKLIKCEESNTVCLVESVACDDVMVCCSMSPDGALCVTGGIYGNLYIWNVHDMSLIQILRLHSSVIISVSLSPDMTFVYSSASDGSKFVTFIDKQMTENVQAIVANAENARLDLVADAAVEVPTTDGHNVKQVLWSEKNQQKVITAVQAKFKPKVQDCKASLAVIVDRLKTLLQKNDATSDLEKLDRKEFVIDVHAQKEIQESYSQRARELEESYQKTNDYNECVAARIRQMAWDRMESRSRKILSLQVDQQEHLTLSSFSTEVYSETQLRFIERVKRIRAIEIRSQRAESKNSYKKMRNGIVCSSWLNMANIESSWIIGDGLLWPSFDVVEDLIKASAETVETSTSEANDEANLEGLDGEEEDADKEIDENNCLYLLYPPLAVRTESQKRIQIALIGDIIHTIKKKFNVHFEKLYSEKEDAMGSINSKNARINEIMEELREETELFKPEWTDIEIAETAITVKDSEISSRPYESAAAKAARLAEEERKRLLDLEKADGDVKGRALDEMMHGVLEVKKDVFAATSALHKPDWMIDIDPADMTEAQVKEMEEFEAKLKHIQEQQENYRKSLELEVKKLKSEIQENIKTFDSKLATLVHFKLLTQRVILTHELTIARLALQLVEEDFISTSIVATNEQIMVVSMRAREVKEKLVQINARADSIRNQMLSIQEEGKSMERSFKRDLQNLCNTNFDQDTLKIFTELYRQRQYGEDYLEDDEGDEDASGSTDNKASKMSVGVSKKSSKLGESKKSSKMGQSKTGMKASTSNMASSNLDSNVGSLQAAAQDMEKDTPVDITTMYDPFHRGRMMEKKKKLSLESQIPLLTVQSIETDCPDGFNVDQYSWSKLQELRTQRIQKEIEEKLLLIRLFDIKQRLDEMKITENELDSELVSLNESLSVLKRDKVFLKTNQEIVVSLKQGQDEVDVDSLVTDYENAMLLPTSVVNKYNSMIQQLGKEKIGILSKIKNFRRSINLIEWEANHTQLEAWHLDEYFTDLQLLRVTRDFQRVIRAGADSSLSKTRMEKLAQRKEYISKDVESKLTGLHDALETLRNDIKKKEDENETLTRTIEDVRKDVEIRSAVKKSRDAARGEAGEAKNQAMKRMQKVVARAQIIETTKSQAQELDLLRQELDKIRQKTFPSFVKAARQRTYVNPDERI